MVGCGAFIVVWGVLALNGRRAEQYGKPRVAGWGLVAMGCGFVVDGMPRLLGLSAQAGFGWASVGMGVVAIGAVAQLLSRPVGRSPRSRGRQGNG
jgi:hypothetical protein